MSSNSRHADCQHQHEASPLLPKGDVEAGRDSVSPFQLEQEEERRPKKRSDLKDRLLLAFMLVMIALTVGASYSVFKLQSDFSGFTSRVLPMSEIHPTP